MQHTCEQCGKPTKKSGRFCSRDCQKLFCRVDTTCPACGKSFWYHKSWPRIYCCRACSASVNAKKNLGIVELPEMHCEQCGNPITVNRYANKRFCSQSCFGEWQSANVVGASHPLYAKVERACEHCGKTFLAEPNEVAKGWGKFCDITCKAAWQKEHPPAHKLPVMVGESNPRWKGGYDPYYGPNWREQRRKARQRDGFTCQHCGIPESDLERQLDVHHLTPFRKYGVENYLQANQLDNLVSLCYKCHTTAQHEYERHEGECRHESMVQPLQMPLLLSIP